MIHLKRSFNLTNPSPSPPLSSLKNEKKMMLTQHENNKLKERDEQHTHELREWRSDLTKRRQVWGFNRPTYGMGPVVTAG